MSTQQILDLKDAWNQSKFANPIIDEAFFDLFNNKAMEPQNNQQVIKQNPTLELMYKSLEQFAQDPEKSFRYERRIHDFAQTQEIEIDLELERIASSKKDSIIEEKDAEIKAKNKTIELIELEKKALIDKVEKLEKLHQNS